MSTPLAYFKNQIYGKSKNLTPAKKGLAADYLKGHVASNTYVVGEKHQASVGYTALRIEPSPDAEQLSQLLYGEEFIIYESKNGWGWGQAQNDYYVGYVPLSALKKDISKPTHRICELTTNIYSKPSGKSAALKGLPFNALVSPTGPSENGRFVQVENGWVPSQHLSPLNSQSDYMSVAERFIDTPYLWGGRTLLGIDCSGLLQAALMAEGIIIPRDSAQQSESLNATPYSEGMVFKRGDIIFFPGHVVLMVNETDIIHANAFHMKTKIEPLEHLVERLLKDYKNPITAIVDGSFIRTLVK